MPVERREVGLTPREVMQAVRNYARSTPGVLPTGDLRDVAVAPHGAGVTAWVQPAAGAPIEVSLSAESILEMMIYFCKDEGIPVPRYGGKSACVMDGLLTLVIVNGASA